MNMTGTELRAMKDEFDDFLATTGSMDDTQIKLWGSLECLNDVERIILYLYAEYGSQRKVAELLHTSRTTVIKLLSSIRNKIFNELDKNGDDKSGTDSDNLGDDN